MVKEVIINTFCSEDRPGSPQFLHFYPDQESMIYEADKYVVKDEFDHSFIFLDESDRVHVVWKNKAGKIHFCGSGAYALGWFITDRFESGKIEIIAKNQKDLTFTCMRPHPGLKVPSCYSVKVDHALYFNEQSGIYLLQAQDRKQLYDEAWINTYKNNKSISNIHGLCVFYWCLKKEEGFLRYFVPWHGRDEDYVTGSIHQYLTPLVNELHGQCRQTWFQESSMPGTLTSFYNKDFVTMSGKCSI